MIGLAISKSRTLVHQEMCLPIERYPGIAVHPCTPSIQVSETGALCELKSAWQRKKILTPENKTKELILRTFILFYFIYVYVCQYVCMTIYEGTCRGQQRESDQLELVKRAVVSFSLLPIWVQGAELQSSTGAISPPIKHCLHALKYCQSFLTEQGWPANSLIYF